jgi:hypothetical protein
MAFTERRAKVLRLGSLHQISQVGRPEPSFSRMVAATSAFMAARGFRFIMIFDERANEVTMVGSWEEWPGESRVFSAGE